MLPYPDTGGSSIDERATSGYPISIATSLAFESIFLPRQQPYDLERSVPNKIDLSQYNSFYINIFTLYRNLSNSVKRQVFIETDHVKLAQVLLTEIEVIQSLFFVEGHDTIKPIFYHMTQKSLLNGKISKDVQIKPDKTTFQKDFRFKFDKVIEHIKKQIDVPTFDSYLDPASGSKALILTHVPFDLISYDKFSKLDLLESNTGKLKSRREWNSKFMKVGDRHTGNIPFNRKLLFVFGDKVMIRPADIKLRRILLDVADKHNWTPMTTMSKIKLDMSISIKEPYVLKYMNDL